MSRYLKLSLSGLVCFIAILAHAQNVLIPQRTGATKTKISLNAYSFNIPLRAGTMTVDDMFDYCAQLGFDAVDLTAYYIPGYPQVPSDEYIAKLKRKAYLLGMEISGTGIRTDFSVPDVKTRNENIELVKNWIVAASKMGAPVIRVFTGNGIPEGYTWDQAAAWIAEDIRTCVEFGKQHGVIVAIQNHNDFLKTGDETVKFIKLVNHNWLGLILDVGSFRSGDPYKQIEQVIPYAVNWQVKEKVWVNGIETTIDLNRLKEIIIKSNYRGYLPIETLGEGEPKPKIERFFKEVKKVLEID